MRVIEVRPNEPARVVDIGTSLEALQKAVDGYIEFVYPFEDADICLMCNEEGKLNGSAPNRALRDAYGAPYDIICGTFIIMGCTDDGDTRGLTPAEAQKYLAMFKEPETDFDIKLTQPRFEFFSW